MAEAMGMSLPGAALVPGVYNDRFRLGESTGMAIVDLVRRQLTADQVITFESLENAIRVLMATGGSTNAVLHLTAIAAELEIPAAQMMDALRPGSAHRRRNWPRSTRRRSTTWRTFTAPAESRA